uniref:Uncharacterized protein n=1 Tax=Arundo donax TaxID=35708 RepID=A0A0A8ZYL2_ARUDO
MVSYNIEFAMFILLMQVVAPEAC